MTRLTPFVVLFLLSLRVCFADQADISLFNLLETSKSCSTDGGVTLCKYKIPDSVKIEIAFEPEGYRIDLPRLYVDQLGAPYSLVLNPAACTVLISNGKATGVVQIDMFNGVVIKNVYQYSQRRVCQWKTYQR